jgi:Protein of unknown function (DUF1573)
MRNAIAALMVLGLAVSTASAQGWAEKMFKDGLTHDFGVVPAGAQLFHRFTITNIYAVRMEIIGLTPTCGCVKATPIKRVLEPRESTTIDVEMDARRFTGAKKVDIRVTVGPEFTSSTELHVLAHSRADIVFNPGEINFGQVAKGTKLTQKVDVDYAGALPWQIKEVVIPQNLPVDVVTTESSRQGGRVSYRLEATLKTDAPAGLVKEFIYLKTNDPNAPTVPLLIEANVIAALSVAPSTLSLGTVKAGEPLTRRVVVRANKPFRILEVTGVDSAITLGTAVSAVGTPVQTITFRCNFEKAGDFKRDLTIKTDAQDEPVIVTIEGTVAP